MMLQTFVNNLASSEIQEGEHLSGRNREMTVVPEPVSKKGINWG